MSVGMPGTSTRSSLLPQRDFFARGLLEEVTSETDQDAVEGASELQTDGAGAMGDWLGEVDGFVSSGNPKSAAALWFESKHTNLG